MIQSGHNFAHVTTAKLSWHVQSCDLIWSLFSSKCHSKNFAIWIMSSEILCEMGAKPVGRHFSSMSTWPSVKACRKELGINFINNFHGYSNSFCLESKIIEVIYDTMKPQWTFSNITQPLWRIHLTTWRPGDACLCQWAGLSLAQLLSSQHVGKKTNYLNQCCAITNWTLGNKFLWNFNQNTEIFIKENRT